MKHAETKVLLIYSLTFKVSTPIRFGIGINSNSQRLLDNSTCKFHYAALVKFESHYNLRFDMTSKFRLAIAVNCCTNSIL